MQRSPLKALPGNIGRPFLSARWVNLALITYALDPAVVAPFVPPGCELDLIDGQAFVSLVAFDFCDTKVLGIRWPGYVRFPEINLRFYVKRQVGTGVQRGVSFVREFVPRRLIAAMARAIYNEPYVAIPITSTTTEDDRTIEVLHTATVAGRPQTIHVKAEKPSACPADHSIEHSFKEHSWGFNRSRRGGLILYEVLHPIWNIYGRAIATLDWDFALAYGDRWKSLNGAMPYSTILAAGSEVKVFPKS